MVAITEFIFVAVILQHLSIAGASVSVDWSNVDLEGDSEFIEGFTVEYLPTVGDPPTPVVLPSTAFNARIDATESAVRYNVVVTAQLDDGSFRVVLNESIASNPDPPRVDDVVAKQDTIEVSLIPDEVDRLHYSVRYKLADASDVISETFSQPLIRLIHLLPSSEYDLSISSLFDNRLSESVNLTVKTLPADDPELVSDLAPKRMGKLSTEKGPRMIATSSAGRNSRTFTATSSPRTTLTTSMPVSQARIIPLWKQMSLKHATGGSSWKSEAEERDEETTLESDRSVNNTTDRSETHSPENLATDIGLTEIEPLENDVYNYDGDGETTPSHRHITQTVISTKTARLKTSTTSTSTSTEATTTATEATTTTTEATTTTTEATTTTTAPTTTTVTTTTAATTTTTATTPPTTTTARTTTATTASAVEFDKVSEENEDETAIVADKSNVQSTQSLSITKGAAETSRSSNWTFIFPREIMDKLPDSYGRPESLEITPEGRQVRISWRRPKIDCSGYLLNYTVTTLSNPKSFQIYIEGDRTYEMIKLLRNHAIEINVNCIVNDSIASKTPARTVADLRKPQPVENLRVASLHTDEFFRSSVLLEWDDVGDFDRDAFTLVAFYYPGKAKKLHSHSVIVNESNSVYISNLKPTETYTLVVKNVSRFNVESAARGLKQIMPPIVSSTLLLAQATSSSLQITYSPTDVDEARFDSYELVACFSDEVNKTFVKSKSDTNRNFLLTNLIPGETYSFYLYTVFKKIRSDPIAANFTTYPLKVKRLFGIVRRTAVKLFWVPEESPVKEIRYRLSFTGSDGSESDDVELVNVRQYVFDYLKPEIWYTFSVTVLMGQQESDSTSMTIVTGLNSDPAPYFHGSTTTTIEVGFRRDFFTESNGMIHNYSMIVTEDFEKDIFDYQMAGWRAVQNTESWPPYQATPTGYNAFKSQKDEVATYTIGIDTCSVVETDEYCNGPLKPRTEYFIKLRACTNENICMETSYTKAATEFDAYATEQRQYLNPKYNNAMTSIRNAKLLIFAIYVSIRIWLM